MWYSWTAPYSSPATIDTCTTNYDTPLGVYTGSALDSLTTVAAYNNGCSSGYGSKVPFDAKAGTIYMIEVDGCCGAPQGNFTLKLDLTKDTTPTTTTATTSPDPNASGTYERDVTVTLDATDDSNSVKEITYSATGAQTIDSTTVQGNSTQFKVTTEG